MVQTVYPSQSWLKDHPTIHFTTKVRLDRETIFSKMEENEWDAYKINGVTIVFHLMYADDILLSKANPKSLNTIKEVLEKFSAFSGIWICSKRGEKCCILPLHEIMGFPTQDFSFFYLGFPITEKRKTFHHLPLISNFHHKTATSDGIHDSSNLCSG